MKTKPVWRNGVAWCDGGCYGLESALSDPETGPFCSVAIPGQACPVAFRRLGRAAKALLSIQEGCWCDEQEIQCEACALAEALGEEESDD